MSESVKAVANLTGLPSTTAILYSSALVSALLLTLAVGAVFIAAVQSRKLARRFHMRMVKYVLNRYVVEDDLELLAATSDLTRIQFSAMQHCIHANKALEALSRTGQNVVFVIVFFFAAFLIEWRIMTVILASVIVFLPVLMIVSRWIHSAAASFFQSSAREMARSVAQLLQGTDALYLPGNLRHQSVVEFMQAETTRNFFDNYDKIQLSGARMSFLTGLVRSVMFGLAMMLATTAVVAGWADVTVIVAFGGALLVAFAYMQQLFSRLANLNLFYPQVLRLLEVIDTVGPSTTGHTKSHRDPGEQLPVNERSIKIASTSRAPDIEEPGLMASVELEPGAVVDILTPIRLSRYNMRLWLTPLCKASTPRLDSGHLAFFANRNDNLSPLTMDRLDEHLSTELGHSLADLASKLDVAGTYGDWCGETNGVPHSKPLENRIIGKMPPAVRALISVSALASSPATTVFLDANVIDAFSSTGREPLRDLFERKILFLWRSALSKLQIAPDCHIVIGSDGTISIFRNGTSNETIANALGTDGSDSVSSDLEDTASFLV